jgi:hypothetical protein
MVTIKNFFKTHKEKLIWGIVLFLVASLSFGLGYLANREFNHSPIIIQNCNQIHNKE